MEFEGLDKLMAKLNNMQGNSNKALQKGVNRALTRVQTDAKRNCPEITGRLRESIVTVVQMDGETVIGTVGTNVDYGPYVEFGTGPKGEVSDTSAAQELGVELSYKQDKWLANIPDVGVRYTAGQPAQPFLFPAYKMNQDNIKGDIIGAVKEEITKRGG